MCGIWQGSGKNRVGVDLASLRKATWPEVLLGVRTQPGVWLSSDHPDLDLFERHPERSDSWPWPHHSRSLPPPNTTIIDTRPSPSLVTGALWSPPSLLPSWESGFGGGLAWWPGTRAKGEEGWCRELLHRPRRSRTVCPSSRVAPAGLGWARPADSSYLLGCARRALSQSGLRCTSLFSGRLLLGCCILPLAGEHLWWPAPRAVSWTREPFLFLGCARHAGHPYSSWL